MNALRKLTDKEQTAIIVVVCFVVSVAIFVWAVAASLK